MAKSRTLWVVTGQSCSQTVLSSLHIRRWIYVEKIRIRICTAGQWSYPTPFPKTDRAFLMTANPIAKLQASGLKPQGSTSSRTPRSLTRVAPAPFLTLRFTWEGELQKEDTILVTCFTNSSSYSPVTFKSHTFKHLRTQLFMRLLRLRFLNCGLPINLAYKALDFTRLKVWVSTGFREKSRGRGSNLS